MRAVREPDDPFKTMVVFVSDYVCMHACECVPYTCFCEFRQDKKARDTSVFTEEIDTCHLNRITNLVFLRYRELLTASNEFL